MSGKRRPRKNGTPIVESPSMSWVESDLPPLTEEQIDAFLVALVDAAIRQLTAQRKAKEQVNGAS